MKHRPFSNFVRRLSVTRTTAPRKGSFFESCPAGQVVVSGFAYAMASSVLNGTTEALEAQTAFTDSFSNLTDVYFCQYAEVSDFSIGWGMVCAVVSP